MIHVLVLIIFSFEKWTGITCRLCLSTSRERIVLINEHPVTALAILKQNNVELRIATVVAIYGSDDLS